MAVHDGDARDGLRGPREREDLDPRSRRDLDDRRAGRVQDEEEVGGPFQREREHPRRGAARQRGPVALERALDDRWIFGEQRGLAAQLALCGVDERADGGDRVGDRDLVPLRPAPREPEPARHPDEEERHEHRGDAREARGPHRHAQRRSPTRWSFKRFVVPETHMGEPEMMTRTSPGPTAPSPRSVASTSSIISSVVWTLRMSREDTPHDRASRRRTSTNGVSAMIGTSGRAWEMRRAEAPDSVNATIARAPSACPAAEAAVEIASENPTPTRSGRRRRVSSTRTARSAR